jgi:hypothetical protein
MKYVRILIQPFEIKADLDDEEQLTQDVHEKVLAMVESETLAFTVDEEELEDGEDY